MNQNVFLKEKEAGRLLSLSYRTLQTWRREGKGPPFIKFGRAVRYRLQDLLDWARDRTQDVVPQDGVKAAS